MKARVTKLFEFEASHSLPGHKAPDGSPGKCSRDHGHSYKLEVTLYAPVVNSTTGESDHGFVMDFYYLSQKVKELIINKYDHRDLNRELNFRTTAELMSFYFLGVLLEAGLPVEKVKLWETRTGSAEAHVDDFDSTEFAALRRTGDWMEWIG
jgi:6-pyruvoyltetrahydropterin/6-carboxytetrahydropterin synthase